MNFMGSPLMFSHQAPGREVGPWLLPGETACRMGRCRRGLVARLSLTTVPSPEPSPACFPIVPPCRSRCSSCVACRRGWGMQWHIGCWGHQNRVAKQARGAVMGDAIVEALTRERAVQQLQDIETRLGSTADGRARSKAGLLTTEEEDLLRWAESLRWLLADQ